MENSSLKERQITTWIIISVVLAGVNILIQISVFSLMVTYEGSQTNQLVSYFLSAIMFLTMPLTLLVGFIDSHIIRLQDYWYYVGAILNSIVWANCLMLVASRFSSLKNVYKGLVG